MIVIAHNIRSLHNVGSIFRSCDVFGVEKLYLTGITGTPPRKEIAKVALGSEHRVEWEQVGDVLELVGRLKVHGNKIVALENGIQAQPIDSVTPEQHMALVLGNEVHGIEPDLLDQCDLLLEIPMPGRKQSLNVSVATGIALFALMRQSR
ncbi:MAG: TrmH family RNA methyltransferase [Candidatus Uhrbacteria bacterium]|nr:TrmH family RNA methyltransferase [Candidatus Uhrbacteria bacterium]